MDVVFLRDARAGYHRRVHGVRHRIDIEILCDIVLTCSERFYALALEDDVCIDKPRVGAEIDAGVAWSDSGGKVDAHEAELFTGKASHGVVV